MDEELPEYGELDLPLPPKSTGDEKKNRRKHLSPMGSVRKLLKSPRSMRNIFKSKKSPSKRLSRMRPSELMNEPGKYDELSTDDKAKLNKLMEEELGLDAL